MSRYRTAATLVLAALVLWVTFPGRDTGTVPACQPVHPGASWEYERVDDQVGQWYAPGDVLEGWAATEDSTIYLSRTCTTDAPGATVAS